MIDVVRAAANPPSRVRACAELLLIVALFFAVGGSPPPGVNETHYLTKAKHYWNPSWCRHDPFLNSADAHLVFYWVFGWLTMYFPLSAVAWIGRLATWGLLAWAWQRFSFALVPRPWYALLTAAGFVTLMQWGPMAGEWVIGGVEAKGFAYVALFLGLASLVQGRWKSALLLMGLAAAFHVLVGGWSLIVLAGTWWTTRVDRRPPWQELAPAAIGAGLLTLVGLIPGLALSWSADATTVRDANRIYVFERLSHHLVFHLLSHVHIARHAVLVLVWLAMIRWLRAVAPARAAVLAPLNRFVGGAVLIAVAGALLDQSLLYFRPLAAAILRYYWFRLSDVLVPLGVTLAAAVALDELVRSRPRLHARALVVAMLIVGINIGSAVWKRVVDPLPGSANQSSHGLRRAPSENVRRQRDWQRVCQWIEQHTLPDDLFLTPRHQQSFKWYAGRSEVVCGKDIPQDATGIVEWRRRMADVFPLNVGQYDLAAHGERKLLELAAKYRFQYLVVDRDVSSAAVPFPRVYPASDGDPPTYEVYRMPPREAS